MLSHKTHKTQADMTFTKSNATHAYLPQHFLSIEQVYWNWNWDTSKLIRVVFCSLNPPDTFGLISPTFSLFSFNFTGESRKLVFSVSRNSEIDYNRMSSALDIFLNIKLQHVSSMHKLCIAINHQLLSPLINRMGNQQIRKYKQIQYIV